jgi:hypothetical protein
MEDLTQTMLPSKWCVWIHHNASRDWKLSGYHKLMELRNVHDFWTFMNNFNKLDYINYQFFIMRNEVTPIWEDAANRNGGAASVRIKASDKNMLALWEEACVMAASEQLSDGNTDDAIVGVSFNLKNDLTVLKIWNSNINRDISKKIARLFYNKYRPHSIVYIKHRADP